MLGTNKGDKNMNEDLKFLIKKNVSKGDLNGKLDKYDIELIATNVINDVEKFYTCIRR
jgi:hypothetical protein